MSSIFWVLRRMGRPQSPFSPKFGQASTLLANLIKLFGVMHASTGAPNLGWWCRTTDPVLDCSGHWITLIRICLESPFSYVNMFILCGRFNRYHWQHASPGQQQPTKKHSQMNIFGVLIPWYTNPTLDNPSLTEFGFILWQSESAGAHHSSSLFPPIITWRHLEAAERSDQRA